MSGHNYLSRGLPEHGTVALHGAMAVVCICGSFTMKHPPLLHFFFSTPTPPSSDEYRCHLRCMLLLQRQTIGAVWLLAERPVEQRTQPPGRQA